MKWPGAIALAIVALGISGCADGDDRKTMTVGAAASLVQPITAFAEEYEARHPGARVRIEFGGSDTIAARIRQGIAIDLYVTADATIAETLHDEGIVRRPVAIARNRLVVAARKDGPIADFDDLAKPGVRVAIGGPNVPIGAWAREALSAKGDAYAIQVMTNVVTNELDVRGVVGKIELGVVDAGIVYRTDVPTFDTAVAVLPFDLDDTPPIIYSAAVTTDVTRGDEANRFIAELAGAAGRELLTNAGFGPP